MAHAEALLSRGEAVAAAAIIEAVLGQDTKNAQGLFLLAQACWMRGDLERAAVLLESGLRIAPHYPEAHNNLGILQMARRSYFDAENSYRRAIALRPDFTWAHCNLGNALQSQQKIAEARQAYLAALALDARHAASHVNLANLLKDEGDLCAAVEHYRMALAIQPDDPAAWLGVGAATQAQGNLDEAIRAFRQTLVLRPGDANAVSGLLFSLNVHPDIPPDQAFAEATRYGMQIAARGRVETDAKGGIAPRQDDGQRALRVGLVSGDLRVHPVGFFIESILSHLDPARVALYAYPTGTKADTLTARILPAFTEWCDIGDRDDAEAAALIRAHSIDILIDLAGHTAHHRLALFALRPAPVQATWLGYFATTGVPGIDYLLTDEISTPPSESNRFSEQLWYLPDGRFCFTPPGDELDFPVGVPPFSRNGYVTFACFQNELKLQNGVLDAWSRIMREVPAARLLIQNGSLRFETARDQLLQRLRTAGIDVNRVSLRGALPRDDYLRAHAEVDIILDTFPYTGATTTCEALWMGVPTVTIAGDALVSRQGASILQRVGLCEWIAANPDEYVTRAITHAERRHELVKLRSELRSRAVSSPLFDAPRFARYLEDALLGMWRHKMGT